MQRFLAADLGGFHKAHSYSAYALGIALPVGLFTDRRTAIHQVADTALAYAIPVHMHLSTNAVVTDYIPKAFRGRIKLGCVVTGVPIAFHYHQHASMINLLPAALLVD